MVFCRSVYKKGTEAIVWRQSDGKDWPSWALHVALGSGVIE